MANSPSRQPLSMGATRHCRGGDIAFSHYMETGETSITVLAPDGSRELVATVCPLNSPPAGPDEVWLKGWSENEGVPEALVAAGVVVLVDDRFAPCGREVAVLGKLTPAALEALEATYAGNREAIEHRALCRAKVELRKGA